MSETTGKKTTTPRPASGGSSDALTLVWQQLGQCVEAFADAWDRGGEPPSLRAHLPASPPGLRWLALVELIKFDLERRWPKGELRLRLEDYLAEFPELSADGRVPDDLIYEEIHIRRQHGETVSAADYAARFPQQVARLGALLTDDRAGLTSALHQTPQVNSFEPGQCVDDFDLLLRLGSGAFGSVFLARQRSLGRMVALKIAADQGFETQTLAQLDHPNIVRVYDQRPLLERRLQLIYMQYLPGGTLDDIVKCVRQTPVAQRSGKLLLECVDRRLEERGSVPSGDSATRQLLAASSWPEIVCWLGSRIAGALDHAHSRGVLHRDLKPANVLLAADGHPRLADFNVSTCDVVPGASASAYFGGSLAYMSPEQLDICLGTDQSQADSLDQRSDLFTLGVLLWELLTGERPFGDDREFAPTPAALAQLAARRRQELGEDALGALRPNCPAQLIDVLRGLLQPDRDRRIASAESVRRQLELCLRPDVERLGRPQRAGPLAALARHPLPLLIAAGVVPNLVLGMLNIAYNMEEILRHVEDQQVPRVFRLQVATINPVAYLIGIGTLVVLAWPVVRAVKSQATGHAAEAHASARWRERSLLLGKYVALVSGIEWFVSGLVFPLWLQLTLGTPTGLDAR
ncbi:MAG TPA: serine/threonine-protein kinase, partial [Pirellulales bacterium]|nr:serine/threonine-protein kinase [Pirellulales bacterium]